MIRETIVNRKYGSSFDKWLEMGALEPDSRQELDTLASLSVPLSGKYLTTAEKHSLSIDAMLDLLEVRLIGVTALLCRPMTDEVSAAVSFIQATNFRKVFRLIGRFRDSFPSRESPFRPPCRACGRAFPPFYWIFLDFLLQSSIILSYNKYGFLYTACSSGERAPETGRPRITQEVQT